MNNNSHPLKRVLFVDEGDAANNAAAAEQSANTKSFQQVSGPTLPTTKPGETSAAPFPHRIGGRFVSFLSQT